MLAVIRILWDGYVGRDSSVAIMTCYGLDDPEFESRREREFPHQSRPAPGPNQPPIHLVPGLFPGGKAAGRGFDHPPSSSIRFRGRVELFLYSLFGSSLPVLV
jgi:hypothetical protein